MIDMQVRSESGEIVTHGRHGLRWSEALGSVDQERFPYLSSLLPYADAVFNDRQVSRLRREVATDLVRDILGENVTSEIERLCTQVEHGSHLYLWFCGD